MINQILDRLNAISRENRRPVLIEIGEAQARAIAEELNGYIVRPYDPELNAILGIEEDPPKPIEWAEVYAGPGVRTLWGVPLEGVESPDYLNIRSEAP